MEIFYECFLTEDYNKKKNNMKIIQTTILIIAAIVYVFLGIIAAAIIGLLYIVTIAVSNYMFIEYEYILTNNELDIVKIINKSKRKNVCTIDISKVSKVLKLENKNGQVSYKKCYVGNEDLKTILINAPHNGEMTTFGLKINDELLRLIKRINPSSFNIV